MPEPTTKVVRTISNTPAVWMDPEPPSDYRCKPVDAFALRTFVQLAKGLTPPPAPAPNPPAPDAGSAARKS